ncbi:MAG: hypothetical protein CL760_05320 [Chloroflexi bacterium]|nr:hypothetical protein [Chloroflexota bacterium]
MTTQLYKITRDGKESVDIHNLSSYDAVLLKSGKAALVEPEEFQSAYANMVEYCKLSGLTVETEDIPVSQVFAVGFFSEEENPLNFKISWLVNKSQIDKIINAMKEHKESNEISEDLRVYYESSDFNFCLLDSLKENGEELEDKTSDHFGLFIF